MSEYHELTLAGVVARRATDAPEAPATFTGSVRNTRPYGLLGNKARRLAAGLARLGIDAGDRIALLMGDEVERVDAMVACSLLGAVFVPLDADDSLAPALAEC